MTAFHGCGAFVAGDSRREALPALRPAALQYRAAGPRGHAGPETMPPLAATNVWLKGSLHTRLRGAAGRPPASIEEHIALRATTLLPHRKSTAEKRDRGLDLAEYPQLWRLLWIPRKPCKAPCSSCAERYQKGH